MIGKQTPVLDYWKKVVGDWTLKDFPYVNAYALGCVDALLNKKIPMKNKCDTYISGYKKYANTPIDV